MDGVIEQKNNEILKLTTDLTDAKEMLNAAKLTMKTETEALQGRNDELQAKCRALEFKQKSLLSTMTKSNQERDQLKNELEMANSKLTQLGVSKFSISTKSFELVTPLLSKLKTSSG